MESPEAVQIFAALSQETRLALLRHLVTAGPSGLTAGTIADRLGAPASTASFHLSALERAGLIQSTRQSRHIIYAVRVAAMRELIAFLAETCCDGRPDLCGDIASLMPEPTPTERLPMTPAFNVLFLCARNSGRSMMAEAILETIGQGRFNAYSAGSEPADQPMPEVIEKLRALGHDVSELRSKSWHEFTGPDAPQMDFVIALCDTLHGQKCPDLGDKAVTGAWPLPDPAKFSASPAERSTMLNELYASLHRRLSIFVSLPFASLDRMAVRARLDEIGAGPTPARAVGR